MTRPGKRPGMASSGRSSSRDRPLKRGRLRAASQASGPPTARPAAAPSRKPRRVTPLAGGSGELDMGGTPVFQAHSFGEWVAESIVVSGAAQFHENRAGGQTPSRGRATQPDSSLFRAGKPDLL